MKLKLSKRQLKNADRAQGLLLIVPWPKELPEPRGLARDEERRATAQEWDWARQWTGIPREGANELVIRGVIAMVAKQPFTFHIGPFLGIELVTTRWAGAVRRPEPSVAWWQE